MLQLPALQLIPLHGNAHGGAIVLLLLSWPKLQQMLPHPPMFFPVILRHTLQPVGIGLLIFIPHCHDAVTTAFRAAVSFTFVLNLHVVAHAEFLQGRLWIRVRFSQIMRVDCD